MIEDARVAWREQTAENSARQASVWVTAISTGWGEFVLEDEIDFGVTFVEPPMVGYGMVADQSTDLVETRYPKAHGGVYRWKTDDNGHCIGATVFVVVDTMSPELEPAVEDPGYQLEHHFHFSGIALKDIHPDRFDDDD